MEDRKPADRAPCAAVIDKRPRRWRWRRWLSLAAVGLTALVVGALVAANWRNRPFSFVFFYADIKAGLVILGSVALGFVLALTFLWSAFDRG